MKIDKDELIVNACTIGSTIVSIGACVLFCVCQYKLTKGATRIADSLERAESEGKL